MTAETPKTPLPGSILDRLAQIEKKKRNIKSGKRHADRRNRAHGQEDRLAAALTDLRRSSSEDPAGENFREELFAELKKLIPIAIRQAKAGKPALLRILTRYSR